MNRRKFIATSIAAGAAATLDSTTAKAAGKKTVKILGVSCSPRKGKTTATAVKVALDAAKEADSRHPQLKFDRLSALTLTLAYSINLPLIRKRFKPKSLERELALPTYVVFLDSQERALKEKHRFITVEDTSLTIFKWWTTIWPFCAPAVK